MLKRALQDREMDKFVLDGNGDTAVRVILSGGGLGNSSETVESTKTAIEVISALKCVTANDTSSVRNADRTTQQKATVFGVALTSATVNSQINVLTFGEIVDPLFAFPLNDALYLANDGSITNVPYANGYHTKVGYSLGSGSIFINIESPIFRS